mgnify:CR=1 FL=1
MGDISAHFSRSEFACGDGTPYPAAWEEELVRLCGVLEAVRSVAGSGRPGDTRCVVTSGYRTPGWNKLQGGVRKSQHLAGKAADILIYTREPGGEWSKVSPLVVARRVEQLHRQGAIVAGGLGWYQSFTHVDTRGRFCAWGKSRALARAL